MSFLNIEIKAVCRHPDAVKRYLERQGARFVGEDRQRDTYFRVPNGRLKLREGSIEYALIHYDRPDQDAPKASHVTLYEPERGSTLKELLTRALGILVVVDKRRAIYFIDNVKFHLDHVDGFGSFVEVEAIDEDGTIGEERLREQCDHYRRELSIAPDDLVARSYSDLLLEQPAR